LQHAERIEKSASLAVRHPKLRALTVDLTYFDREFVSWGHHVKYRANLDHAKSIFRVHCPSGICVGGDFDLTKELDRAVAARQTTVSGQMRCEGSRRKPDGEICRCQSILHYNLILAYNQKATVPSNN
jgi:hypothetical protein